MKIFQLFVFTAVGCLILAPLSHSQGIKLCTDQYGNTVYTDNACPEGFTRKQSGERSVVRVQEPSEPEDDEKLKISWDKYKISLENVEMGWHLVQEQSDQEAVIYPQVDFTVSNNGAQPVARLKVIMSFTDETNQSLGATHQYIKIVKPGAKSETVSMSPSRGYSYEQHNDYNDYKKNLIMSTKLRVEITARYMGEKKQIATLDFASNLMK